MVIALHLMNTNGLLAAGVLSALWAHPDRSEAKLSIHWLTTPILAGLVIVGMTGAITALGDTLFPVSPTDDGGLIARINEGTTTGEHFLVRLRIVHPIIAVLVSVGMMFISAYVYGKTQSALLRRAVKWVIGLVALQVSLGVLNVLLYAPGWMQLVHLLAADILWIVTVVMVVLLAEDEAAQAGLDKAEWVSNPLETQGTA